jgi:peptide/nickel transport system ATP-binding protein/oligopeptide transport system ATP-binding protein
VLDLLIDLQREFGLAYLFISHDMAVVERIAHRVAVMYAGQIVEQAGVEAIFAAPSHPYTRALFDAIPRMDLDAQALAAIPGRVPPLDAMPAGCRFQPRCPLAQPGCELPQVLADVIGKDGGGGHQARCHVATGVLPEVEHA